MSATINTIPASQIVSVTPSVIGAGGTGLQLVELMLDSTSRIPIGSVLSFPSAAAVSDYAGPTSDLAVAAGVYFQGFDNSTTKPAALLATQYPTSNVGAYLRGGSVASLTLTQLQALTGVLTISIDGTPHTSSSINLASATSFSNAAELITTALGLSGPIQADITAAFGATFTGTATGTSLVVTSVTGTIHPGTADSASISGTGVPSSTWIVSQSSGSAGGAGTYITNQATTASSASITATSTTVDVSAVADGTIALGQEIVASGVTAGTYVTALGTGTGGTGTYVTTQGQHVASKAMTAVMPTVTYDAVSGGFLIVSATTGASSTIGYGSGTISAALKVTAATGAVLSQGAVTGVPGTFMDAVVAMTTNWATFQTLFDPDASGNANKQLFAAWTNAQDNRYAYLAWDTDITPTQSTAATSSLGYILEHADSSGSVVIYEGSGEAVSHIAAFVGGLVASIDFSQTNGRTNGAFRRQTGLSATVSNGTVAANLIANSYNFYGAYATAADEFVWLYPGSITGPYTWLDSFVNQIWLNNAAQLALMTMLDTYRSIPYNPVGYGYIRAALQDPINAGVNNGVIRQNVPLSAAQISEVNAAAGQVIDRILATQGWYLVIQAASAIVRAARGSPTIILFYMDGQSVQRINLSSVLVQ